MHCLPGVCSAAGAETAGGAGICGALAGRACGLVAAALWLVRAAVQVCAVARFLQVGKLCSSSKVLCEASTVVLTRHILQSANCFLVSLRQFVMSCCGVMLCFAVLCCVLQA